MGLCYAVVPLLLYMNSQLVFLCKLCYNVVIKIILLNVREGLEIYTMRKIIALFLIFVFVFSLVGCTSQEAANTIQEQTPEEKMANSHFVDVINTNSKSSVMRLVYDSETKIVYYYQNYHYTKIASASMCPYYSENGYLCRYNTDTNQLEEIIH